MHTIHAFQEIGSTNDYLKENYEALNDGDVFTALHQTKGRGRLGRVWQDEKKSLLFSLLLKDDIRPDSVGQIPLLTGASVLLALQKLGLDPSIKWPNDVLLNDKKCAGILVEAVSEETIKAIIVGVGINLNGATSDPSLANKAIAVNEVSKKAIDKEKFLLSLLDEFDRLYADYLAGGHTFINIIQAHSYLNGKMISLDYYGEGKKAIVFGIDNDGRLAVGIRGETKLLSAGEVTLTNVYPLK